MSKKQIVNEIHRTARKNFPRRSVVLKGIDDLWQADLADLQNFQNVNKGFKYILVVIDAFSKYAWCVPVKSKTKLEIRSAFEQIIKTAKRKPKHLQTDLGKEFYNSEFKHFLNLLQIKHYSTFSIKKASIVERLIKTLKSKLYRYFSFIGNYKWAGKPLNDIVNSYNQSMHRSIGIRPIDVSFNNESEVKDLLSKSRPTFQLKSKKFSVGDRVRISKYKGDFHKGYTPNWSTELFTIKQVRNTLPVTYHLEDQRKNAILGTFYEQELQKTKYPDVYLIEKIIKKKGNKLYVKWLGLSNNENSWIDRNDIV
jgi:hypothetical protein